jgi:putative membrane protein
MIVNLPYCGAPATPFDVADRWNLDPPLLMALAMLAVLGVVATYDAPARRAAFALGWAALFAAFVSPLCALSVALFSARIGQHLLIVLGAAPLLAWAAGASLWRVAAPPAAAVFAALFWLWHLPAPYAATLESDLAYWAMQLSLLGSATLLWNALMSARGPGAVAIAALLTAAQMSVLSAILLSSAEAWHPWHEAAAAPWGLTALEDQAAGAALMWALGPLAMCAAAIGAATRAAF